MSCDQGIQRKAKANANVDYAIPHLLFSVLNAATPLSLATLATINHGLPY